MESRGREPTPEEERILVLTPTGRDAEITVQLLRENGMAAAPCRTLEDVVREWQSGAGALLLAEEAISHLAMPAFIDRLMHQEPWSDLPILLVTGGGNLSSTRLKALDAFAPAGNVTFLERPFRKSTLLRVLQVALRARRRQYQMRDNMEFLRKGEERLRLAMDAGRIAVWEWDLKRKRFACTERLYSFAGVPPGRFSETLEGFAAHLHPEDAPLFLAAAQAAVRGGQDFDIEFRMRHGGEEPRRVHCRGRAVLDAAGAVVRIVGAATDITDRVRAEAELRKAREGLLQAQKLEAIGKLAGGIAHDFNNMLTAINGYSEILLPSAEGRPDLEEGLKEILTAGRRAAALTQQLLAYSRRQIMTFRPMDINLAVRDMAGMLERLIGEDIETVFELGPDLPPILADLSQVEQIILNLALNARDALPSGGRIRIATSVLAVDRKAKGQLADVEPGKYVRLEFSDNGVGMTPEVRAHIFDPFFTTKEQGKGTGMGLPTVYGIVKQSSGHILVESEAGKGSTFTVLFPASAHREVAAGNGKALRSQGEIEKITLLIAEDEEPVRRFLKRFLESQGYTVLAAANGEAALELEAAFAEPIDLLVTDVVMPGMNGRELADRITRRRPGIRVLFVSGYTDDALLHHGVLDPERAFLNKPFASGDLLDKIRSVLKLAGSGTRTAGTESPAPETPSQS